MKDESPIAVGPLAVWRHPAQKRKRPKARVLIIHGISEHSGRHGNTVDYLTSHAYEVIRFDLRGAGLSGGRRQWIADFSDYVFDTVSVFNWVCSSLDEAPLFILGHSLGGAVATYFAADYNNVLRGLVLSAPAFRVGNAVPPLTLMVGKALCRIAPSLTLPRKAEGLTLSRDPAVAEAYAHDPLACHDNPLQQAAVILEALPNLPVLCERITVPTLLAHGSEDRVIRVEGSFELVHCLGAKDRTLHVLPGGYHEPHNDIDRETYFALLRAWLDRHVA